MVSTTDEALEAALAPLNALRACSHQSDLAFTVIEAESMPQPFRKLLVHERDMTQTLETFYGDEVHLEVQQSMHMDSDYIREVTLNLKRCGTPVEYGAIRLFLDRFSENLRTDILADDRPLGALINSSRLKVSHTSGPFFSVVPDDSIRKLLRTESSDPLYGRCNLIRDPQGVPIARVVEILPQVKLS